MDVMEKLLASSASKIVNIRRGQEIEGEIVAINDSEIILDLGAKSEAVLPKKEFSSAQLEKLKIGEKVKAFVIFSENENGQVVLSLNLPQPKSGIRRGRGKNWLRFKNSQTNKSKLSGTVVEINKGGLIVEADSVRGFLPNSLSGFEVLNKNVSSAQELIGQAVNFLVSEVDENANKLIFTQKGLTEDAVRAKLRNFKKGQNFKGKVVSILPFGVVVEKDDVRGLVLISEVAWERTEDLSAFFKNQEIEALVLGVDEDLGRLNLSIKQLNEDPFVKLAQIYPADEVVKGEITNVSDAGVVVALTGAEGFLPSSKMDQDITYEVGKSQSFLVDGADTQKRRITLAPFRTSTEGLIYK
ncbi:30S ribosomal protein S1 [Candidatus Daviesbacteria bacterium]|nr:30S ribosomal protein S1 [Candidatus Daviesbacteria bacterium]